MTWITSLQAGLAALGIVASMAGSALAQSPTSPRLEELRESAESLRLQAAEIGESSGFLGALSNLRAKLFEREEQGRRLDQAIEAAAGTLVELEAYRDTEDARRIFTHQDGLGEMKQDAVEFVIEAILVRAGQYGAAAAGSAVTLLFDVGTVLAKKQIKESDLAAFRVLIAEEKLRIEDLYALKLATEIDRTNTAAKVRQVEGLRALYARTMDEVGAERQRLATLDAEAARAREAAERLARLRDILSNASLVRDADALGDIKLEVEQATGLPVVEWEWHWSARRAQETEIYYCRPWSGIVSPMVDGTDRYNAQSGLCHSGVHAGAITEEGGFLRVRLLAAEAGFKLVASTRHGITSGAYGSKDPTFVFVPVLQ